MRLLTRADFDGSVCAAILQELGIVDEIQYVHPKDLQNNKIVVGENDVLANVPYAEGCGLWFDHHSSEHERLNLQGRFKGASQDAPSAAQVIYDYYQSHPAFSLQLKKFEELVRIVGIADSARFSKEDILDPQGWTMLAFIADPRTGLGHRHTFRISNYELMKRLPQLLRTKTLDEILAQPDIKERIEVYRRDNEAYKRMLLDIARTDGHAVIIDLRGQKEIPVGNRFLEYTLFPEQNISIRISDGKANAFAMISVGHSIFNRSSQIDVGSLTLKYRGGGHRSVGTCQVKYMDVDRIVKEMLSRINSST